MEPTRRTPTDDRAAPTPRVGALLLVLAAAAASPWTPGPLGPAAASAQEAGEADAPAPGDAIERLRGEAAELRRAGLFSQAPDAARDLEEALDEAARRRSESEAGSRVREALDRARRALGRLVETAVLGPARRDSAGARQADAHELAPRSWAEANALLERADALVGRALTASLGERTEPVPAASVAGALQTARSEAGPAADAAARAYRSAWRIAFLADSILDRPRALEEHLAARDSAVALTAREAGVEPTPHDGPADDLAAVRRELVRRADSAAALRERLARTASARDEATRRADSLAAVLDSVERRLATAAAELERRRARESRIREVKALFASEEGSVYTAGDSAVIRLTGLTFPPGESELGEEADPLLVKLQSAVQAFPGARIRVEGHTDARGDAEQNRVLSLRRAIAVREHLLLQLPISADRITAVGVGESEPVASNDSEEGRARNRRIDVVLLGLPD